MRTEPMLDSAIPSAPQLVEALASRATNALSASAAIRMLRAIGVSLPSHMTWGTGYSVQPSPGC